MNCDRCKEMGMSHLCFPLVALDAATKTGDAEVISAQIKALENNNIIKDNCINTRLFGDAINEASILAKELQRPNRKNKRR